MTIQTDVLFPRNVRGNRALLSRLMILPLLTLAACGGKVQKSEGPMATVQALPGRLPDPGLSLTFVPYCIDRTFWQNKSTYSATAKTFETLRSRFAPKLSPISKVDETQIENWCRGILDASEGQHLDLSKEAADHDLRALARSRLKSLDLSHSNLTDEHLAEFRPEKTTKRYLMALNLSHNRLTNLNPIADVNGFDLLRRVDASHNALTTLAATSAGLSQAEELNVSHNPNLLSGRKCAITDKDFAFLQGSWSSIDVSHTGIGCISFLLRSTANANNLNVLTMDGVTFSDGGFSDVNIKPLLNRSLLYFSARGSKGLNVRFFGSMENPLAADVDKMLCWEGSSSPATANCFPSLQILDLTDASLNEIPREVAGGALASSELKDRAIISSTAAASGLEGAFSTLSDLVELRPASSSCSGPLMSTFSTQNLEMRSIKCEGDLFFGGANIGRDQTVDLEDSLIFQLK